MLNDPEFAKEVEEMMNNPSFKASMEQYTKSPEFKAAMENAADALEVKLIKFQLFHSVFTNVCTFQELSKDPAKLKQLENEFKHLL